MRATAKLTFLVAVMAMTASVNAWAQTHDRSVDAETPAEKSVTPQLPPVFAVNNNIVGYYYLPTTTIPEQGRRRRTVYFSAILMCGITARISSMSSGSRRPMAARHLSVRRRRLAIRTVRLILPDHRVAPDTRRSRVSSAARSVGTRSSIRKRSRPGR